MSLNTDIVSPVKNKVLHFMVQDARMCIHLNFIKKVLPLVELKPVPGSPNYLAGLMNFKGQSIPIIDLAIRTGLARNEEYSINVQILLCEYNNKYIGFIVDKVLSLTDINESLMQVNEEINSKDKPFLGTIINDQESSLIVNMDYLYGSENK